MSDLDKIVDFFVTKVSLALVELERESKQANCQRDAFNQAIGALKEWIATYEHLLKHGDIN